MNETNEKGAGSHTIPFSLKVVEVAQVIGSGQRGRLVLGGERAQNHKRDYLHGVRASTAWRRAVWGAHDGRGGTDEETKKDDVCVGKRVWC